MAYQLLTPSDGDLARCVGVQIAEFKNGPQLLLAFKIHDENSPNKGRVTTYFGSFGDKSIDFTVDALRACGWQGDDLGDLPAALERGELNAEVSLKIVNEQVLNDQRLPVYDEAGNEKWRDKIAFVNVPGDGGAGFKAEKPLEGADLKNFGSRMRTAVANAGRRKPDAGGKAAPRGSTPRQAPARGDDRDIPPPSDEDMGRQGRGW